MTKTSLYKVRIFAAVAAALFIVQAAPIASASTMYSQTTANAYTTTGCGTPTPTVACQLLSINFGYFTIDVPGSLLSNTGTKYINYVSLAVTGSGSYTQTLTGTCYYSSSYTGTTCGTYSATSSTPTGSYVNNVINFTDNSSTIIASSTTYVRYTLTTNNPGTTAVYLSYNNSLSSIAWVHHTTPNTLTSLGTPYLVLASNDLGGNNSYLQSVSLPNPDSVTPVSTRFYFKWWHGVDEFTESGVQITDITSSQSIYTVNTPAYSTGQNTFDQYITLTNNHLYQWRPYIYNPNTQVYLYGNRLRFSVGTQQSPFVNSATDINTALGLTASDTALINSLTGGINNGTSTAATGIPVIDNISNATERIRYAFPLDYIFDSLTLLTDIADGYNDGLSTDVTWSYSNGIASTTLVVIDSETVGSFSLIVLMKSILGMFVYISWALLVPKFMIKLI